MDSFPFDRGNEFSMNCDGRPGRSWKKKEKKMTIVHPAEADASRHAWLTSPTFRSSPLFPYLHIIVKYGGLLHYINARKRIGFDDRLFIELEAVFAPRQFPLTFELGIT